MGDYWHPSLPGLKNLSGDKTDLRDLADQMIAAKFKKAMEALTAPSEREKFMWQQQQDIEGRMFEEAKFVTNKFIEAYNAADSPMEKQHVYEQSRAWLPGLPPRIQAFVHATFSATPLSDSQKRMMDFLSTRPRPEITVKYEDDPATWQAQRFAQEEHTFQVKARLGDQDLKRRDYIPTPDGGFAYKNPETGIITQIPQDRLEILDNLPLIKKHNKTVEQVVANGGKLTLNEQTITDGSQKYLLQTNYDIGSGEKTWDRVPIGVETTKTFPEELPKGIQDFIGMLRIDEDDRPDKHEMKPMVELYQKERIRVSRAAGTKEAKTKETNLILKRTIGSMYPGWNFRVVDYDPNIVTGVLDLELDPQSKETIRAWPGSRTYVMGAENSMIPVWEHNGHYYSHLGEYVGTEDAMLQWAMTKRSTLKWEKK